MIAKLGGTRAIIAYILAIAFVVACFTHITGVKFNALATMATMALGWYFSNKATLDQSNK